jgi:uncharacterized damage-inducible protein DinB
MTVIDWLVRLLEDTRVHTLAQVEELTDAEMMFQPKPTVNHPLWLLGHIVTSEDGLILRWCAGKSRMPKEYQQLFALGSKPQSDPSLYPKKDAVLRVLADVHAQALKVVKGLTAERLEERPEGYDEIPARARELFWSKGACISHHATHESGHAGQISMLRRLLGKPYRV